MVSSDTDASLHEPPLLRGVKLLEFRSTATQHDPAAGRVRYQVERNEPSNLMPVSRLDHEMRERSSHRVKDNAAHMSTDPVATADLSTDPVIHALRHVHLSLFR